MTQHTDPVHTPVDTHEGSKSEAVPEGVCPQGQSVSELLTVIDHSLISNQQIARIAHEVNRAWCQLNGDMTQPPWDLAPEWQKISAINGVQFHRDNPDAGDDAAHNSWMAEKLAAGWKHGYVKDADKKEHPCITEYVNLPQAQQFKDRLFRTVVHAALGSHIV